MTKFAMMLLLSVSTLYAAGSCTTDAEKKVDVEHVDSENTEESTDAK